ncbi:hypothetical protein GCM10007301_21510 [Azorhizobium oxalatiphilum]|uniref:Uncharacterized protein n=1 Tax=Azorhizobium oxalatiphilum TaxID=980631 RepID=A0A917BYQ6_9HYPH|nr:hypothetical protein [Azorhizobium oxalatiphilum]GGF61455.1 hypothetical protein GCM10007301_21510 [Azorhizobium oxalatiphilum]
MLDDRLIESAYAIGEQIGDLIADAAERSTEFAHQPSGRRVVEAIATAITERDEELRRDTAADYEIGILLAPYVMRFLQVLHRDDFRRLDGLPELRVGPDRGVPGDLVPIDAGNRRALESIMAVAQSDARRPAGGRAIGGEEHVGAEQWQEAARAVGFVEMQPHRTVARNFFSLFTVSFWSARKSVSQSGVATINFTVDCASHGYQLEYWPRFLYSPVVFGGCLTRPVSAHIPVNHYRFQGWIGGHVTPDGGLYQADASHTNATLRAF